MFAAAQGGQCRRRTTDLGPPRIQGLLLLERDDQVNALKIFKEAVAIAPNQAGAAAPAPAQ